MLAKADWLMGLNSKIDRLPASLTEKGKSWRVADSPKGLQAEWYGNQRGELARLRAKYRPDDGSLACKYLLEFLDVQVPFMHALP